MTISNLLALLGAMIILAMTPDTSVIAVMARAIASGLSHSIVTIIGLLCGDFIFILFAVSGLSAIAQTMSSFFLVIKYFGGIYLIWLGIKLWRTKSRAIEFEGVQESSWWANFLCGFLITMSDPKAILFYVSFLPAFVDLTTISPLDVLLIMLMATIALGSVKLVYAYMADQARVLLQNSQINQRLYQITAIVMIVIGLLLIFQE